MVSQNKYGNHNCHYFTNNSVLPEPTWKVIGFISLLCIVFCAISYTMIYTPTSQRRLRARVLVRKSKDFTANNSRIFMESNETKHITTHRNSVDFTSSTFKPEKTDGPQSVHIRILCWIMTCPNNLHLFAIHVKNTWGKRCDILLFMSSKQDKDFPAIGLDTQEGRNHLTGKAMQAWRYVYEHYRDKADWFLKADDDTYVIVENLQYVLKDYNTSEPIFFGQSFVKPDIKQPFNSGGPGYVLSKEALMRLGTRGNSSEACKQDGHSEDVNVSKCLLKFGVKIGNTLDKQLRTRFHHLPIDNYLFGAYPTWYYTYNTRTPSKGPDSMSDYVISFHYVKPDLMHIMDFFIYHMKLYNIHSSRQSL